MIRAGVLFAALAAAPAQAQTAPASPPVWKVDPARSVIQFKSSYAGTEITGRFSRWTAAIAFDPARPETARVTVDVDLASARTGDGTVDPQLPTADWFNSAAAPRARFTSQSVTATGPGRYLMKGTLAMRGASVPVELPFTLKPGGATAEAVGSARLDRRAFKLGLGSDPSGEWVAFAVPLEIRVVAARAATPPPAATAR